jgi:TfoX/Sxy family transcriptional regulator of competence genes
MPYDEVLGNRIRTALGAQPALVEKKMFGGIGFMLNGNMVCGVYKDCLIVRIGPEKHTASLARPHTRLFDITGRTMTGWIMVESEGCATEDELQAWLEAGLGYARSLPPKKD